jgi:alkylmercury lyase
MAPADQLAQQLDRSLNPPGNGGVFHAVLTLLAEGKPVPKAAVARALGLSEPDTERVLAEIPSLEFDEAGNIVGAYLSLRPTPHQFEIGGKQLYTWCALDTLIFPLLLGRTARVISPCAATGLPVRLRVGPKKVGDLEPASAVVSLQLFEGTRDVRNAFCRHSNFFASEEAAASWLRAHPAGWVLPVGQAHALARDLARRIENGAGPKCC